MYNNNKDNKPVSGNLFNNKYNKQPFSSLFNTKTNNVSNTDNLFNSKPDLEII